MPKELVYSTEEILDGLREADKRVDGSIKFDEFDGLDGTIPAAASSVADRFGGWNRAKEEAGLPINRTGRWDNRETSKSYRRKLKEEISCTRCGENFPDAIAFHHPEDVEKEFEVTRQPRWPEDIKKEAEKCVSLCKNCHTKHHSRRHDFNADNMPRVNAPEVSHATAE